MNRRCYFLSREKQLTVAISIYANRLKQTLSSDLRIKNEKLLDSARVSLLKLYEDFADVRS